jgi:hypothetical protein
VAGVEAGTTALAEYAGALLCSARSDITAASVGQAATSWLMLIAAATAAALKIEHFRKSVNARLCPGTFCWVWLRIEGYYHFHGISNYVEHYEQPDVYRRDKFATLNASHENFPSFKSPLGNNDLS